MQSLKNTFYILHIPEIKPIKEKDIIIDKLEKVKYQKPPRKLKK